MPLSELDPLAILAAATSAFALGGLWYSPLLFLKPWLAASPGVSDEAPESASGHPARVFGVAFLFAALAAVAFAWTLGPAPSVAGGLQHGLVVGVGFAATSFGINYQFANRRTPLLLIDGGYHVAQFVLYGVVLGLFG